MSGRIWSAWRDFDLVYSSLALHYVVDLEWLLTEVFRTLVPGGSLVFSVEHPMVTAPARQGWSPMARAARSGRSTATWTRARAARIG